MAHPNDETSEDSRDTQTRFAAKFFAEASPRFSVELAAATHPGRVRPRNEDHYAVVQRTRISKMLMSNLPSEDVAFADDHAYALLIADGIGGAQFGDLASQLALETLLQAAGMATSWLMKYKDLELKEVQKRVAAYVDRIQETFLKHGLADPDKRQMGTTFTSAYLLPPHVIFAHIGDSRAYLLRGELLSQITHDQTLAQAYQDAGVEKSEVRKFGHVLVNSLGSGRDKVVADVSHVEMRAGDRLLLCTDGLSDLVDSELIAATMSNYDLQSVCDNLIQAALDEGGRDNITVIVCQLNNGCDADEFQLDS